MPLPVQLPLYARLTTPSHVICTTIWNVLTTARRADETLVMLVMTPPTTVKSEAASVPNGSAWLNVKVKITLPPKYTRLLRLGSLRRSKVDWMLGAHRVTAPLLVDVTASALELACTQLRYWMFPGSETEKPASDVEPCTHTQLVLVPIGNRRESMALLVLVSENADVGPPTLEPPLTLTLHCGVTKDTPEKTVGELNTTIESALSVAPLPIE